MNLIVCNDEVVVTPLLEAMRSGNWPLEGKLAALPIGDGARLARSWCNALIDDALIHLPAGSRPEDHWCNIGRRSPELLERVSRIFTELMWPKLGGRRTKLSGVPYCGLDTLSVRIRDDGTPTVHPGPKLMAAGFHVPGIYTGFSDLFVAMGERVLIHIAGVLTAREHLRLDGPLILHGVFRLLDGFHRTALVDQLDQLNDPVVVFEDHYAFDSIKPLCSPRDTVIELDSKGHGHAN